MFQELLGHKLATCTRRNQSNGWQSNSINLNCLIDLDWVRQSSIIELTQTFCQSNTIKHSKIKHFFNRTESNSRPIEPCPCPALCHSKPVSFGFKQCIAVKKYLCVGFYFNHVHPTYMEKMAQVAASETYNFRSGCQRLSRVLFCRRHSSFNSLGTSATTLSYSNYRSV